MKVIDQLFRIKPVYAHCDLPCGVYDPAQAYIEAQSVLAILEKYDTLDDANKVRAQIIKEERAQLVKHHLMCYGQIISSRNISNNIQRYMISFGAQSSKRVVASSIPMRLKVKLHL